MSAAGDGGIAGGGSGGGPRGKSGGIWRRGEAGADSGARGRGRLQRRARELTAVGEPRFRRLELGEPPPGFQVAAALAPRQNLLLLHRLDAMLRDAIDELETEEGKPLAHHAARDQLRIAGV